MESWYFAYGSNLLKQQMLQRIGSLGNPAAIPRVAHLANYRLTFQHLDPAGPAYANIITPGPGVSGVVYRLNPADLQILDNYEAGYERQPVTVTDQLGESLTAVAYIMRPSQPATYGIPTTEYLQKIITGAGDHGLSEQYIGAIRLSAGMLI